ncbi:MAG TPA: DUF1848 domain-containing protein [Myxococcota bacterium]
MVSASRRTDIPALYARWFANRIRAGYCTVPNPRNARQISRVSLRPEDVAAFVFWTRFPRPLFDVLPLLDERGYRCVFQFTLTGYGRSVEARTPPLDAAIAAFRELAARRPPGAVVWRYDPILVGPAFPPEAHLARFRAIATRLRGAARRVVVSLLHPYAKARRRLGPVHPFGRDLHEDAQAQPEVPGLLRALADVARAHDMTIESCASPVDWSACGIGPTKCVDDRLLAALFGGTWPTRKDPGQREHCGCVVSRDIGASDTCTFGCRYCYATSSDALARRHRSRHDPESPSLWTPSADGATR